MAAYRDPWALLGVDRNADDAAVKKAYRRLARENHPDLNKGDEEKAARFQDISRAYNDIGDEKSRSAWLAEHESQAAKTFGGDSEFFSPLDEPGFTAPTTSGLRRDSPRDVQEAVTVTFQEAFEGTSKEWTLAVEEACSTCGGSGAAPGYKPRQCTVCRGTGEHAVGQAISPCGNCGARGYIIERKCPRCENGIVRHDRPFVLVVPAGVRDGQKLRLAGQNRGRLGNSDIVITVNVATSGVFRRTLKDASDLLIIVPITYSEACIGHSVKVPTPDKAIQLRIPAGTQTNKAFRIPGKGMPKVGHEGVRGDLYARVQVVVPAELSGPQRKLITQLGNYDSDDLRTSLFAALRT